MLFRQLFDPVTSTYTYLLADPESKEAILIDPVREQVDRDEKLINELGLSLRWVFDTHVHADHVTGAGDLRKRLGAKTCASEAAKVACADRALAHHEDLSFGTFTVQARKTPGHTDGCMTYVVTAEDKTYAFTGDTLLIRGCGRTDFQQGSAASLYRSVRDEIFSLPDDTLVYPGHDYRGLTVSTVGEEKAHNPRLKSDMTSEQFEQVMAELKLKPPAQIDIAVPANLGCGLIQQIDNEPFKRCSVDDVDLSSGARIIDVRGADEFNGELGHITGAQLHPLEHLKNSAADWDRDARLILVCRSGARSARACETLAGLGFDDVTNLEGGMLAWNDQRGPASTSPKNLGSVPGACA